MRKIVASNTVENISIDEETGTEIKEGAALAATPAAFAGGVAATGALAGAAAGGAAIGEATD